MSHSEIPHKPTISILGLGAMGTALAEAFIRQKYPVTVWNRSSAKAQPLVEKGATHATSVAKALENSETIIVCLLSQNVIEKTLQDSTSLFAGRTIVNLTNGTPAEAQNLNQFVTSHGGTYLQGGIMGVPAMVATEAMVILYSGNGDTYEKLESHLRVLGNGKFLGPDPGHASLHDQALLAGMYGLFMGFLQSISMIRAGAKYTSATQFTKELWTPWLTVMTAYCGHMAEQIDKKDYATQGSSLAMQLAAIDNIVKTSEGVGVDAELIKLMSKLMTGRVRQGGGAEDISSLVECMVSQDRAKH